MRLDLSLQVELTAAGYERARLAQDRGEKSLLGSQLPIRKLSVEDNGLRRVYLIGPVRQGGKDKRLARIQVGIKR